MTERNFESIFKQLINLHKPSNLHKYGSHLFMSHFLEQISGLLVNLFLKNIILNELKTLENWVFSTLV